MTTNGMAALTIVDDVITLLNDSWIESNGGKKPTFVKQWEEKTVGMADSNYETVLVSIDGENPQIYSMLQGANTNDVLASNYDWLHDVSLTLDVRCGASQDRVNELAGEVTRILKGNVVPIINNTQYIRLLLEGSTPMNEEYRNLFRWLVSCSMMQFNP